METQETKYFSKVLSTEYDGNVYEDTTSYTLRIPDKYEDVIASFECKFSEANDGKRGVSIVTKNLDELSDITDDRDPVKFRENHSGLELEEVISFKDELVNSFVEIVNSNEFKEITREAGVSFGPDEVQSVLRGELNQFSIDTEDGKEFTVYTEVDGSGKTTVTSKELRDKELETGLTIDD